MASQRNGADIACFYHIWADGAWEAPAHQHFQVLRRSYFDGSVHVGLVGSPQNRDDVQKFVAKFWGHGFDVCASADTGYEQVTLNALREYVHGDDAETFVLYAHTKGAYDDTPFNEDWRYAMTEQLIRYAHTLTLYLYDHDAIGLHWLTPEEFPELVTTPFFGGNFWLATTDYLRTLPPVGTETRYDAEAWIGLNNPKVHDLDPGWPSY